MSSHTAADKFPRELLNIGGVIGDLVRFMRETAISPQPVLALGASLVLVGTLAGGNTARAIYEPTFTPSASRIAAEVRIMRGLSSERHYSQPVWVTTLAGVS